MSLHWLFSRFRLPKSTYSFWLLFFKCQRKQIWPGRSHPFRVVLGRKVVKMKRVKGSRVENFRHKVEDLCTGVTDSEGRENYCLSRAIQTPSLFSGGKRPGFLTENICARWSFSENWCEMNVLLNPKHALMETFFFSSEPMKIAGLKSVVGSEERKNDYNDLRASIMKNVTNRAFLHLIKSKTDRLTREKNREKWAFVRSRSVFDLSFRYQIQFLKVSQKKSCKWRCKTSKNS